MTINIDVTYPNGATNYVSVLDDAIHLLAAGTAEWLNVDHYCTLAGTSWPTVANGAGKHTKITFKAAQESAQGAEAGELILYTYADGDDTELFFDADGYDPRQVTKDGRMYLIGADLEDCVYLVQEDEETDPVPVLSLDDDDLLTVVVDDDTIEMDADNGLQIKVPDADGSGSYSEACFVITGYYTGNGAASRTITIGTGVKIRHLVVHRTTGTIGAAEMINRDSGHHSWGQPSGANLDANLTDDTNGFWVDNSSVLNANGVAYMFVAVCVRA